MKIRANGQRGAATYVPPSPVVQAIAEVGTNKPHVADSNRQILPRLRLN